MSGIQTYNAFGGIPPDPVYHVADDGYEQSKLIEEYADSLMNRCTKFSKANDLNIEHDLYDGDLLPKLMQAIAEWSGKPDSSHVQMKKLHNILADALQAVAEKECA